MPRDKSSRRRFLEYTALLATVGTAGCSTEAFEGPDDSSKTTDAETNTDAETDTDTRTKTSTDTVSSTSTAGPGTATESESTATATAQTPSLETDYNSRERYARPGELYDDFEDLSEWSALSGSLTSSSTAFTGSQSAKLVGENGSQAVIERALSSEDFSDTEISLAIRTPTPDDIAVNVRLVDPFGNTAIRSLRKISYGGEDVGWFRTAPGTFKSSGDAFDIQQVERLQVQMLNASEGTTELLVDDMRTRSKPENGYIVLSWDDNREVYFEEAAPINDEFGYPVSMATAPRLVGDDGFMSVGQLRERQEAGDEIISHGTVGLNYEEMASEELDTTLRQNKKWLINHGFEGPDYLIYPGNNFDATTLSVATNYHYAGGMNQSGSVNTTGVYSFDPLVLPRTIGHDLDIAKRVVDNVAEYRNCGILNFHDFAVKNTINADEYEQLLQYIEDQGDAVEVITLDELWEMRTRA